MRFFLQQIINPIWSENLPLQKSIQNLKINNINSTKRIKISRNAIIRVFSIKIDPLQLYRFSGNLIKDENRIAQDIPVKYQLKPQIDDSYFSPMQFQQPEEFNIVKNPLRRLRNEVFSLKTKQEDKRNRIFSQFINFKRKQMPQISSMQAQDKMDMPTFNNTISLRFKKQDLPKQSLRLTRTLVSLKQQTNYNDFEQQRVEQTRPTIAKRPHRYFQGVSQDKIDYMEVQVAKHILQHGVNNQQVSEKFNITGYCRAINLLKKIFRKGVTLLKHHAVELKIKPRSYIRQHAVKQGILCSCISKLGSKQSNDDEKTVQLRSILLKLFLIHKKVQGYQVHKKQIIDGTLLFDKLYIFMSKS